MSLPVSTFSDHVGTVPFHTLTKHNLLTTPDCSRTACYFLQVKTKPYEDLDDCTVVLELGMDAKRNEASFHRITGKFPFQGLAPILTQKSFLLVNIVGPPSQVFLIRTFIPRQDLTG
jgi:hypothetical protein